MVRVHHRDDDHTGVVFAIKYGSGLPDDAELRLCGDLGDGRRAVELGISSEYNALAMARAGAKAIAIDPEARRGAVTAPAMRRIVQPGRQRWITAARMA